MATGSRCKRRCGVDSVRWDTHFTCIFTFVFFHCIFIFIFFYFELPVYLGCPLFHHPPPWPMDRTRSARRGPRGRSAHGLASDTVVRRAPCRVCALPRLLVRVCVYTVVGRACGRHVERQGIIRRQLVGDVVRGGTACKRIGMSTDTIGIRGTVFVRCS